MSTWLVIANSTHANIYDITQTAPHKSHHHPLKELSHEESRLRTSDLVSDSAGRQQSQNAPKSAYEPNTTPHEKEIQRFAKEIAHYLETERNQNRYKDLIICAAPHFHGVLNNSITKQIALLIKKHIEKDYLPLPKAELFDVIEKIYQHNLVG